MSWAATASDGGRAAFAASRALLSRQSLPSAVSFSYRHLSSSGSKRAGIAEESQLVPAPAAAIPPAEGGLSVQLVRDFIHNSLYHPTDGYFSKQTSTGAPAFNCQPVELPCSCAPGVVVMWIAV